MSLLIRLLWLWGAVGFLLALVGILGRVTLFASVDALKEAAGAVKAVVATATLAATAGASVDAVGGGSAGATGAMGGGVRQERGPETAGRLLFQPRLSVERQGTNPILPLAMKRCTSIMPRRKP